MLISPMMRMYCLVVFLLTGFCLSAQENTFKIPDSLKTKSFEELKKQFYNYEYKDLVITQTYAQAMLELALRNNNASQIHQAEHYTARISTSLGKKEKALKFIEKALLHSQEDNDSVYIIKNLYLNGKIYADYGEYEKAIDYYVTVCDLLKNDPDQTKYHMISHNIALIKNQIGDVRNAVERSKKNLHYFQSQGATASHKNIINSYLLLVSAYSKLAIKNQIKPLRKKVYLDSSMIYINESIDKTIQYNDKEAYIILLVSKGINYYELEQYDRSLKNLNEAEQLSNRYNIFVKLPMIHLFQGKVYYNLGQFDNAILYSEKATAASKTYKIDLPYFQEILILLAKSYEQVGDTANAIKYYKLFSKKHEQNDLLKNQNNKSLYEKYDIPSLENKIKSLENKTDEIGTKYKYVKYIAWSLICLLLAFVFFYTKRQYQYKRRFEKLLVQIDTLEKKQQESLQKEDSKSEVDTKVTTKKQPKIADEKVVEILNRLKRFEEKEQFLSNKCTLNYVAKKVKTNSTYFSIVLQKHKKKKFVQYISDLRIEYALQRLKNDSIFRSFDVKSIAKEVGFNTSESFSKAFKKRTGIYPSFFIKNLEKLKVNS